ncbi:Potassium channel protein [Bacillus pseudomycoides]|uniref:potassium channel protein n=1 Tax=Bacillus pseudomycoides TaxID=64104 RepID=UPI0001A14B68|nr:potassium channel protein [Bacillus pseudomycoides]EEM08488.1 Potassium channel protein [Bacillus pseudomycoides]
MNARRQLWIAVICMCFVVVLGTIGFMMIEEISLFQAFWMTMITVLTVGYGDAVPLTQAGKLLYVHGDATEDQVLRKAGITRAAGLVAIVANDAENVFITLTARRLNRTIKIVARAEKPETEGKLRRAGANKVINPSSMAGIHIAKGITNPLTVHYIDTVLYGTDQAFAIEEVQIGERSFLIGKTLIESNVRNQFDVTILAILRDGNIIHNPTGQEKLQEHDMIIVFGPVEKLGQFEKELQSTR